MFFVKLGFSLLLGLMASMVFLQMQNGWPGFYIACNWLYILLLAVYVWILFYGPSVHTRQRPGVPGGLAKNHRVHIDPEPRSAGVRP